jgi:hypothetical protein
LGWQNVEKRAGFDQVADVRRSVIRRSEDRQWIFDDSSV